MKANPFLGVLLHAVGGLAAASFYIPFKRVRDWAWETYWLVGGIFSWLIAPWVLALLIVPNTWSVLEAAPRQSIFWTFLFGVLWGIGGLTFGLTMRYLGIALGYAIALGFCAAFGTLIPPIYSGQIVQIVHALSGQTVLFGVGLCLVGIGTSGAAGMAKERELSPEQKRASVAEFSFWKGVVVAVFCGIMSASMSFAFASGKPIAETAIRHGVLPVWQNLPVLVVVLAGGFATNFIWCVALNLKNGTGREYFGAAVRAATSVVSEPVGQGTVAEPSAQNAPLKTEALSHREAETGRAPLGWNYTFCAIAGVTWYLQFFFYGMGTTKMGKYNFSSWTLHMASIIIFSTLWGAALSEWKGTSRRTHLLIGAGLAVLIASTLVVGYGNYLGVAGGH